MLMFLKWFQEQHSFLLLKVPSEILVHLHHRNLLLNHVFVVVVLLILNSYCIITVLYIYPLCIVFIYNSHKFYCYSGFYLNAYCSVSINPLYSGLCPLHFGFPNKNV